MSPSVATRNPLSAEAASHESVSGHQESPFISRAGRPPCQDHRTPPLSVVGLDALPHKRAARPLSVVGLDALPLKTTARPHFISRAGRPSSEEGCTPLFH